MSEVVTVRPTPKQREAYATAKKNLVTLYGGAIRGGKSWWLLIVFITWAFEHAGSRWAIIRKDIPTMKRTILKTLQEILDLGFSQYVKSWNASDFVLKFNNGSEIFFMAEGYEDDKELNRFKGLEVNGFGLDEVNELQHQTFLKCIERAGSWNRVQIPPKILMTCNPTQGWVKDQVYDRWKEGTLPDGIAYVPAKITDNPYLNPDYIKSLEMLPRFEYEVFVNGNWDIRLMTGGEFFKAFSVDKHVIPCGYNPELPLHISFDFNVNPAMHAAVFQIHRTEAGHVVRWIDEIICKSPDNNTPATCREILRRYHTHSTGVIIYGDPAGKAEDTRSEKGHNDYVLILQVLEKFRPQLRVAKKHPPVAMSGMWVNSLLREGWDNIDIEVSPECKAAINDLLSLKEDSDGGTFKEKTKDPATGVSYEKFGHLSDCFRYFLCEAFINSFHKYQKSDGISTFVVGEKRKTMKY